MQRFITILLVGSIALLPSLSLLVSDCRCHDGGGDAREIVYSGDPDGCCSSDRAEPRDPEENDRQDGPCDSECPRACCAATVVVATLTTEAGRQLFSMAEASLLADDAGMLGSPHLRGLKRPPRQNATA